MFGFKKKTPKDENTPAANSNTGLFGRLTASLGKTRASLTEGMATLFLGAKQIDDELLEELETLMLMADIGIDTTKGIIDDLTQRVSRHQLNNGEELLQALKQDLGQILQSSHQPLQIDSSKQPYIILMVGINGAGKTTTIGKLAKQFQNQGKKVMLAAGDTFRAAAVEQLQVWGERNDIPVIAQASGADSAAVIHDALQAAQARKVDILIADTAGRLHTQQGLMEELKKVKRVIQKLDADGPHEVMLVLDAGTGQNALTQAREFHQALGVSGITVTKLDGTAKGGILFPIAQQLSLPIRYIGVGEGIDDLQVFNADQFVAALFASEDTL
ncbi:MAG: signal recognition particle-docking protein FtsY [Gammaproteobacteria bacterium]|nr:signal recognition particle-docking protein FtsY [Gammaproteobacteria bacterium]